MPSLDELRSMVTRIACKGLCTDYCCSVPMTDAEADRLNAIRPTKMTALGESGYRHILPMFEACALLVNGRCAAYAERPMICRLWGVAEGMPCPHGCKAERILTKREAHLILDMLKVATPASDSPTPGTAPGTSAAGPS